MSVVDYCGVRCTDDYFCTIEDGTQGNVFARSRVDRVALDYGNQASRPIVQVICGALLMGFLAWPVYRIWVFYRYGGTIWFAEAYVGVFALLGAWIIFNAFQKGWFLRLDTGRNIAKLPFSRKAQPDGLREFVRRVEVDLGVTIQLSPEALSHGVGCLTQR